MVRWYRKIIYAAEPKDSNSINNNNNNSINSNNNNREREKSAWYPLVAQLLKLGMKDDYKFEVTILNGGGCYCYYSFVAVFSVVW